MPELTPAEQTAWEATQPPGTPVTGSPEPIEGKCAADIHTSSLGLRRINCQTSRYCKRKAGWGTPHEGSGHCKTHLGNTPTHLRRAAREEFAQDFTNLSDRLKGAVMPGEPEVVMVRIAALAYEYMQVMTEQLDLIQNQMTTEDRAGVERIRALVEAFERSLVMARDTVAFMMKHGLAERVIALEEKQAAAIGQIMLAILFDHRLELTEEQLTWAKLQLRAGVEKLGPDLEPSWALAAGIIDAEVVEEIS